MTEQKRFCIKCKQKEPHVDTVLEPNVNISEGRWSRSDYTCDDCHRDRQKHYHGKEKFSEYLAKLKEETIEEFDKQWNDPDCAAIEEMADRVRTVWDRYDRTTPDKGIRRDWICEVVYPDMWFIDANGIVEDYFDTTNKTKAKRLASKSILLEFIASNRILERLQAGYKEKARNRWTGIVASVKAKYAGLDKLVARPAYEDPFTHEMVDNWYLLTEEKDREKRERINVNRIERINEATRQETKIVKHRQEVIEERQKQTQSENKDNEKSSGGENNDKRE